MRFFLRRRGFFKALGVGVAIAVFTYSLSFAGVFVTRMVVNGKGSFETNEMVELFNSGPAFAFSSIKIKVNGEEKGLFSIMGKPDEWSSGGVFYFGGSGFDVNDFANGFDVVGTTKFTVKANALPNKGGTLEVFVPDSDDSSPRDIVRWGDVGGKDNDNKVLYRQKDYVKDFAAGDEMGMGVPNWAKNSPIAMGLSLDKGPVDKGFPEVPEPSSLSLLFLAVPFMMRKKR